MLAPVMYELRRGVTKAIAGPIPDGSPARFLEANRYGRGPGHSYELAEFGLAEAAIEAVCGKYIEQYAATREWRMSDHGERATLGPHRGAGAESGGDASKRTATSPGWRSTT